MNGYIERAREALVSAQLLFQAGQLAGAANRAYYAFLHAAQAAVADVAGVNPRTIKTHSGLRRLFDLHVVAPGLISKDIAAHFSSVESTRLVADYDDEPLQRDEVDASIQRAAAFLDARMELLNRHNA